MKKIIENVVSKRIGRYRLGASTDIDEETKEIKIEAVEIEQQRNMYNIMVLYLYLQF